MAKNINSWQPNGYGAEKLTKLQWVGGLASLTVFLWFLFIIHPRDASWDGNGQINVFPQNAEAKNYRLDASITATIKGKNLVSNYTEYTVTSGIWPDGGTLYFRNKCVVSELRPRELCLAEDGKTAYWVEIETPPSAPSD